MIVKKIFFGLEADLGGDPASGQKRIVIMDRKRQVRRTGTSRCQASGGSSENRERSSQDLGAFQEIQVYSHPSKSQSLGLQTTL